MRDVLRQCRLSQRRHRPRGERGVCASLGPNPNPNPRIVRAEKEECEARLKELCKTDELLTSRSEKAAAATSSAEAPAPAN